MTRAADGAGFGRGGGTVVNVTVSPHHGMPAMAHTGAARAAVEALTARARASGRADGITVVAAAIGRFDTESLRKYPEVVWRGGRAQRPAAAAGARCRSSRWLVALLASPLGRALSGLGRHARRRAPTTGSGPGRRRR